MSIWKLNEWEFSREIQAAMKGLRQLPLVFALVVFLSGCYVQPDRPATIPGTPPPFSCERFFESRWREFRFGVDSPDDVALTASRLWGLDKEQVVSGSLSDGFPRQIWSDSNREVWSDSNRKVSYTALFRKGLLYKIDVRFDPPPTLAQVLSCLGHPEYYSAYEARDIEEFEFYLSLWYLEKGMVVLHFSFFSHVSPTSDLPAQRMEDLKIVAPGTPEEMVPNFYPVGYLPSVQAWGLCILRPWPGSIKAIEIESFLDEEERRCKYTDHGDDGP